MDNVATREGETYPIRLEHLAVRELYIKTYRPISADYSIGNTPINLSTYRTDYDAEAKVIQVGVVALIGEQEEPPLEQIQRLVDADELTVRLRVDLLGVFRVDETKFPIARLDEWAKRNAPTLLFPFLREQIYGLSSRCGMQPIILPLVTLPTIKIQSVPAENEPAVERFERVPESAALS